MDESLSDFQEPKKITGPKKTLKTTKPDKPKKAPKRIRGQKDIRKALKSKKNELESYSKDFDHVCRKAGLDVDSEQLQLAIALSKSLQQSASNSGDNAETSQSLSLQDRVGKIKSTLLEYGFKVPDVKITSSRRLKKRKHYKLLITSEEAKKQIIVEKYSQVLFRNITHSKNTLNTDTDNNHIQLYHLATNATYNILKSVDTFYVDGLVEKSSSTGNLLREWSEIPGRPVSPKFSEPTNMNFSEIKCSQDELDIVLSGSLKSCKNVIKTKAKEISVHKHNRHKELVSSSSSDNSLIILIDDENSKSNDDYERLKVKEIEIMHEKLKVADKTNDDKIINLEGPTATVNRYRSCSPDLFDDEPSTVIDDINTSHQAKESPLQETPKAVLAINHVMDLTEYDQKIYSINANYKSQLPKNTNSSRFDDFMEITECVDVKCVGTDSTLKQSQIITKRLSNDYMEITNCVASPVQPLNIEADVDLTQSPVAKKSIDAIKASNVTVKDNVETLNETTSQNLAADLFQINIDKNIGKIIENIASKHSSNEGTPKVISIEESNIDLTKSPELVNINNIENITNKSIDSMDLTQSSNTSEELPFVSLKTNKKAQSEDDPKDYEIIGKSLNLQDNDEVLDLTQNITREEINHGSQESNNYENDFDILEVRQNSQNPEDILDLTQEILITSRANSKTSDTNISLFEDYIHNHSDNNEVNGDNQSNYLKKYCKDMEKDESSENIEIPDIVPTKSPSLKFNEKQSESEDIDLTQNSESSEELIQDTQNKANAIPKGYFIESDADSEVTIEMGIIKTSQRCSSLGKKDNVSVDYDELYDNFVSRHSDSQRSRNSSKTETDQNISNVSNTSKDISQFSQNSEVFVITDNELDYSMHQSKLEKPVDNFLFGGLSIMDELSALASFRRSTNIENNSVTANNNVSPADNFIIDEDSVQTETDHVRNTKVKHKRVNELATPQKPGCSGINTVVTPGNSEYFIKTVDVTPMPKYESMSLEELHRELDKFGVKPFKRKRGNTSLIPES